MDSFTLSVRTPENFGAIRVVVTDDDGKSGNAIRVVVAEAPLVQKETVSPGIAYSGIVRYPAPYLTQPNLKLTSGKRHYDVIAETEFGFNWVARLRPDDLRADASKDDNALEKLLGNPMAIAELKGNLKPGLSFEDFTWEAKGLRAPPYSLPPKPFEQKGKFTSVYGQTGVVNFPVPYRQAPSVELGLYGFNKTFVTECTPTGFKWKNTGPDDNFNNASVDWVAQRYALGARGCHLEGNWISRSLARRHIPQHDRIVKAPRGQQLAVRTVGHGKHQSAVSL